MYEISTISDFCFVLSDYDSQWVRAVLILSIGTTPITIARAIPAIAGFSNNDYDTLRQIVSAKEGMNCILIASVTFTFKQNFGRFAYKNLTNVFFERRKRNKSTSTLYEIMARKPIVSDIIPTNVKLFQTSKLRTVFGLHNMFEWLFYHL